jgi:type I restriction enzyme R subunit
VGTPAPHRFTGTPFEPEEPDPQVCLKLHADILGAGVFTQEDAATVAKLLATGTDAEVQAAVGGLRLRFHEELTDPEERKAFVHLLARFVKSFHFFSCFFTYAPPVKELAVLAEYVGPQLIKEGSVSDLMKHIRQTEVIKAAVEFQGEVRGVGTTKVKSGGGAKGAAPPPAKVSIQDMIAEIRAAFDISDEEALYIKQVTEEKGADPIIHSTVATHREDRFYLDGAYRGQVNGEIQTAYNVRGRYEELADQKYIDAGGIFDIMAVTVIQHHLSSATP